MNVYVFASSDIFQLSAMSGIKLSDVSKDTSPPNISTTTADEVVSPVRCGSKVGGSLHILVKTLSPDLQLFKAEKFAEAFTQIN